MDQQLRNHIFLCVWIFGFISGFTLLISGNTLNFWFSKEGVDKSTIGLLSMISLPYAVNFLWAPLIDSKKIPYLSQYLGRQLSWVILVQLALILSVLLLSFFLSNTDIKTIGLTAFIIAFLSSTQDSALNSIKTSIIPPAQQGEFSGFFIFGYRVGMAISGAFAIYLSSIISWNTIYQLFAFTIFLSSLTLIYLLKIKNLATLDPYIHTSEKIFSIKKFFTQVFHPIGSFKIIILISCFLIFYRLPDNFIHVMLNPFLLEIGFSEVEISYAGKLLGTISATIGGMFASYLARRYKYNLLDCLLYFGIIHSMSHVFLIILGLVGKNLTLFIFTNLVESFSGGMAMAAYIGFISSICSGKYRATQHSFFSSMMGLSRSILPSISGYVVNATSWSFFFFVTILITIPAIIFAKICSLYLISQNPNKFNGL